MLVPALFSLFFVGLAEHSGRATGNAIKKVIIALLNDPLNLLDERSPGGRGLRVLLSIKGPHERVLSTVRERASPMTPAVANAVFAAAPEALVAIPIIPSEYETLAPDQVIGSPSFPSSFSTTPLDYPNIIAGSAPAPNAPVPPAVSSGGAPTPNAPMSPLALLGAPPPDPGIIIVSEPATWAMMILGFLAIGVGVLRGVRR